MPIHKTVFRFGLALCLFALTAFGAHAQTYTIENNRLILPSAISFKTGTATLTDDSQEALAYIKKYLDDKTYITLLRIECHSDNMGNEAKNQQLTERRAMAVCDALVLMGADCKRLLPVGFGSSMPVASNDTPEGRAQNRRVSVVNASLRSRPIGGMPVDGGGKIAGDPCPK